MTDLLQLENAAQKGSFQFDKQTMQLMSYEKPYEELSLLGEQQIFLSPIQSEIINPQKKDIKDLNTGKKDNMTTGQEIKFAKKTVKTGRGMDE